MPERNLQSEAAVQGRPGSALQLSQWDNEGGAGRGGPKESSGHGDAAPAIPELTNTEVVQLRIRVIALENVVIALLADAGDRQHDLVRSMAAQIAPRDGSSPHPLTIEAAAHMAALVDRARHYRSGIAEA